MIGALNECNNVQMFITKLLAHQVTPQHRLEFLSRNVATLTIKEVHEVT
jgi:hypothetical protein